MDQKICLFKDDIIYIADTGSKRIVKMDLDGHYQVLITGLNEPTGIHVDENNDLFTLLIEGIRLFTNTVRLVS